MLSFRGFNEWTKPMLVVSLWGCSSGQGWPQWPSHGQGQAQARVLHCKSQPHAACMELKLALVFPRGSCFSRRSAPGSGRTGLWLSQQFFPHSASIGIRQSPEHCSTEHRTIPRPHVRGPAAASHRPRRQTGEASGSHSRGGGGAAPPSAAPGSHKSWQPPAAALRWPCAPRLRMLREQPYPWANPTALSGCLQV